MLIVPALLVDALAYGMALFLVSIGLSLTMGVMRVVNLAHGVFAMVAGYGAALGISALGLPYALAAAAGIGGAVALAVLLDATLFRRLYGAGELTQVLMTVGLVFCAVGLASAAFGPGLRPIPLPEALRVPVDLGFRTVAGHRLAVIATGLAVAGGLWLVIERTRFGARLRATIERPAMAACLGVKVGRVRTAGLVLAAALAGLGGIAGAEVFALEPAYPLRHLVVFLVVVCVGGAGSVAGTFAAAVLLGALDTLSRFLAPDYGEFFLYLAVVLILVLSPRGLFARAAGATPAPGSALVFTSPAAGGGLGRDVAAGLAVAALGAAAMALMPDSLALLTRLAVLALFATSLALVTSWCGVATLGHAALFGAGAYGAGIAAVRGLADPLALLAVGAAAGAVAGLLSGLLLARATGLAQLVLSIALGQLAHEAANKAAAVTGGSDGLSGIDPAPLLGLFPFDLFGQTGFALAVGVLALATFAVARLARSPFALACAAVEADPLRLAALGIAPRAVLVKAYGLAGALAGLAGALSAVTTQVVGLDSLSFTLSAEALVMLVLGGAGSLFGPLAGTAAYGLVQDLVAAADPFRWMIIVGALLIAVVLAAPDGLAGLMTCRARRSP